MKAFSLIFLSVLLLIPRTSSAFSFAVVGALNSSTPNSTSATNYGSKFSPGYGFLAGSSIVPKILSLEFGALSLSRKYSDERVSSVITSTQDLWEVPVLLRLWLGSHLSLGVGGYYGQYTGKIKQATTTG